MAAITSIPVNDRREIFTATGGQTVFTFDFPVYAAGDIAATRLRNGITATLSNGIDFTVAGANTQAGGSITLTTAALAGDVITVISNQPIARTTRFPPSAELASEDVNIELNKLAIATQQLAALIGGGIRVPAADGVLSELPPAAQRAGFLLGFDPITGAPILVAPATVLQTGGTGAPYDMNFDFGLTPISASDQRTVALVRTVTFPAGFAGSSASVGTAPAATATFQIFAGFGGTDTLIGTMTITTSKVVTFASVGGTPKVINPAIQNYVFLRPPNPSDASLAGLSVTLLGSA